jgi:hypothetical protein
LEFAKETQKTTHQVNAVNIMDIVVGYNKSVLQDIIRYID